MAADPVVHQLSPASARKLIGAIVSNGIVVFSGHAIGEMKKDKLESTDCLNVLRGGIVHPAEFLNGEWRYRIATPRIAVVVAFVSDARLRVVTAWRFTK